MPTSSWIISAVLCAVGLTFLTLALIRITKPIKCLVTSSTQGLCALGLLNALSGMTGLSLGFSWLSLGMSTLLGIPGVIGMIVINTIVNI